MYMKHSELPKFEKDHYNALLQDNPNQAGHHTLWQCLVTAQRDSYFDSSLLTMTVWQCLITPVSAVIISITQVDVVYTAVAGLTHKVFSFAAVQVLQCYGGKCMMEKS